MLDSLKFTGECTVSVGIAEVLDEFRAEQLEVTPERVLSSMEVWLEPLEGSAAEVGYSEGNLGAIIREDDSVTIDVVLEVRYEGVAFLAILAVVLGRFLESFTESTMCLRCRVHGELLLKLRQHTEEFMDLNMELVDCWTSCMRDRWLSRMFRVGCRGWIDGCRVIGHDVDV